jgi:hypothetical protein
LTKGPIQPLVNVFRIKKHGLLPPEIHRKQQAMMKVCDLLRCFATFCDVRA